MMSSGSHHFGKVVPRCRRCSADASEAVVYPDGDVFIGCSPCANAALGETGREYPLDTYYAAGNRECVEFTPMGAPEFDLYDPDDNQRSWISADNSGQTRSFVDLTEMR